MSKRSLAAAGAGVVAAMLVLAGCGSSGTKQSSSTAATGGSSSGTAASGSPINLGAIVGTGDDVKLASTQGLQTAESAINASGGIAGHPVKISICDDGNDANAGAQCARKLISQGVVAFVGNNSPYGANFDPLVERAGMANIESNILAPNDLTSPNIFLSYGGTFASGPGGATVCAKAGAKRIAVAYLNIGAGAQSAVLTNQLLGSLNLKISGAVGLPPSAADLSTQAAALIQLHPDCVLSLSVAGSNQQLITALRQLGYKGFVAVPAFTTTALEMIKAIGSEDANNVILVSPYDASSPLAQRFEKEIAAKFGDKAHATQMALRSWWGVNQFKLVVEKLPTIDRATTLAAFKATTALDTQSLTAKPVDYSTPGTYGGGKQPNIREPYTQGFIIKSGKLAPFSNGWINVFTGATTD
jgi:branched-chain amino acid transport system substrate-binding protein